MNALILGLGSIGQRHLRNLRTIKEIKNIYLFRKKFITPTLSKELNIINQNLHDLYNVKYLKNLNNLSKYKIDVAFICSPTSMHASQAFTLAKNNINIFIEKPINHNLKNIKKLTNLISKNQKIKHMVGYQLKFNPLINKLKFFIQKNEIGKIFTVQIHHGEHIADFHPYEDYKGSYAASKKLGGGVVLTQSHEIDYLMYLFENFKFEKKYSTNRKSSNLNINVEDNSFSIIELKYKNQIIDCFISLNYFERPKARNIELIGSEGKIKADLINNTIELNKGKKNKKIKFKINKNLIFKKEIEYFINVIKKNKKVDKNLDIFSGIKVLKNCLKILKN